ncbi:MAG: DNA mismatch repair protein MutS [Saprospiraceae bacterium]
MARQAIDREDKSNDSVGHASATVITPLMRQYNQIKAKYPDALLLFRVGDFYETFGEDAIKTARTLGIVLTKRNNGGVDVELAGFPYHSLDNYLSKLVKGGYRVAICEQLEKPSKEKKIVLRGVTEIITPGVVVDDKLLDHRINNYLGSLFFLDKDHIGLAFLDLSTGEFLVTEGNLSHTEKMFQTFQPTEIIFGKQFRNEFQKHFGSSWNTYPCDDWLFQSEFSNEQLLRHFKVSSMKGFGIEDLIAGQTAAGGILHYLESTENRRVAHIHRIQRIHANQSVWLDPFTIQNLELVQASNAGGTSLLQVIDGTVSPMGARLLRRWLLMPLTDLVGIEHRQAIVQWMISNKDVSQQYQQEIKIIGDLERQCAKIALCKTNPRDLRQIAIALASIQEIQKIALQSADPSFQNIIENLNPCLDLQQKLLQTLIADAPVNTSKGGFVQKGINEELDELKSLVFNSKEVLLSIQQREAEKSGIPNLKIGYNAVFGYYLEVTARFKDAVGIPPDWIRKQTLTSGERYITEELKILESKILGAEEKMITLETDIFQDLLRFSGDFIPRLQANSQLIAQLDCLIGFAMIAQKYRYCKPEMNDGLKIELSQSRHPVIEYGMPAGQSYIPNDIILDPEDTQMMVITGPNMSGKSALLRQTALISILAQIGSYVPADSAKIGIVDKVFTRVGASDNLSSGESTFMVEMNETASILNNISTRSLIILDEIGRGTSTYDGISLAWSIAEFLHDNPVAKPKTLFATHYHELNELAEKHPRIKNYHVAVLETKDQIIFLRKLEAGGSQHSFGIHVAKMAGMPKLVVDRARQILSHLETQSIDNDKIKNKADTKSLGKQQYQLSIFESADPIAAQLKQTLEQLDVNTLSPMDALLLLHDLSNQSKSEALSTIN